MNSTLTDLTCNRCGETFRRKQQVVPHRCPNCGSADLFTAGKESVSSRGSFPGR